MGTLTRPLCAAVAALALAGPVPAQEALEEFVHLVRARSRAAYVGKQIVATHVDGRTWTLLVRVEQDPVGWSRLEYRTVGARGRYVVVRRGRTQIEYDPHSGAGRLSHLPAWEDPPFADHWAWLVQNYRVTARPSRMLGRPTLHVEITPHTPDRPRARFEVDRKTGVFLRAERIGPDGRLGEVSAFLSFEPRPPGWRKHATPPQPLRLAHEPETRPASPSEIVAHFGRKPPEVAVPSGFRAVADLLVSAPQLTVQRVYSDGLSILVVYQRPGSVPGPAAGSRLVRRSGGPVWVRQVGIRTVVHWTRDGWLLTAVGDLAPDRLLEVADRTGIDPGPRLLDRLISWLRELGHLFARLTGSNQRNS